MKKELFNELLESVREMVEIRKGKRKPARVTRYKALNPKIIRAKSGLTQERFAGLLGVKLSTYRNWEQGRRGSRGPAQVLLIVADFAPDIIRKAIHAQSEMAVASELAPYEGTRPPMAKVVAAPGSPSLGMGPFFVENLPLIPAGTIN